MKLLIVIFLLSYFIGCDSPSKDIPKPKKIDSKTDECIKKRFEETYSAVNTENTLERMKQDKGWIDLTIDKRRKDEKICLDYSNCMTETEFQKSMIFSKCLKEIENDGV